MAERSSKKTLRVGAALVVVTTENGRVQHLYKGDVLPEGTSEDSVKHLQSLGFLTEGDV